MLKLENFDALRLSIASPEMILSWSHGEVTKPETINYRTLKPERDGLFCEKIFGPTKDWECHCGKYKRYRYKGIICDKCGVEVTRSKVRRERMGHIKLASPVSHVWYFKGIPSRMGLLLDMSPRNLEKVLYFANYIVTSIDEKARADLVAKLDPDTDERVITLSERVDSGDTGEDDELQKRVTERQARLTDERQTLEAERETRVASLRESARDLDERVQESKGHKAVANMALTDGVDTQTVVTKGTALDEDVAVEVQRGAGEREEELVAQFAHRLTDLEDASGAEVAGWRTELEGKRAGAQDSGRTELETLRADIVRQREELAALTVRDLLTDTQYREYVDRYGKVFKAGIGAAAVRELLNQIDLAKEGLRLREESKSTSGQRRQKAIKRLRVVEAFRKSSTAPAGMVLDVLPVIPPELRPVVQLDGGRFATSDLNDLYRRVINRNNRLKRLLDLGAPEIIVRNEKRMLQEAVDALIDNGRRGRAITGTGNRKLKSLSDMLKGKQGRFRQNLLGKRVDYSGRSVIVVGPQLKLHQCGLPKEMAVELFKPFVMKRLVDLNHAQNIKSAKRMVERAKPVVWDVPEEVITEHPVLLNRAPTLHRLGIQAFEPQLVEGKAIQIHPLVCTAFNADFDGDQMAVHLPLSAEAQAEARILMLSTNNILSPATGRPIVTPTQDMVIGIYCLTREAPDAPGTGRAFTSPSEALMAYDRGELDLQARIEMRLKGVTPPIGFTPPESWAEGRPLRLTTTLGRCLFNETLPDNYPFVNYEVAKKQLSTIVNELAETYPKVEVAAALDALKDAGFHWATRAGVTIAIEDVVAPPNKREILEAYEKRADKVQREYDRGLITDDERRQELIEIWTHATADVAADMEAAFPETNPVWMMVNSGARGNPMQVRQIAGMRGLVSNPKGETIPRPIKSSFREGLSVVEYFISTHGARKGLADTALRTADSGHLTRRLVDVAQDVIVREEDCGTDRSLAMKIAETDTEGRLRKLPNIENTGTGRSVAEEIEIDGQVVASVDSDTTESLIDALIATGVDSIRTFSVLVCEAKIGVCAKCYGRSLATGKRVDVGEAVGIVAAQSIGEPGTQLTMRTFHTGGVAGQDITHGLPRIQELF